MLRPLLLLGSREVEAQKGRAPLPRWPRQEVSEDLLLFRLFSSVICWSSDGVLIVLLRTFDIAKDDLLPVC